MTVVNPALRNTPTRVTARAGSMSVALETTLLVHGVPSGQGLALAGELASVVRAHGAEPAVVGVVRGEAIVGLRDSELLELLSAAEVPKANSANLGVLMHRKSHAATTVSATMELAAAAGVRYFATGGLGGVHRGYGEQWDISADLGAFTRFPVGVVTSGVKSILDVEATREALETLGVPVVGYRTDCFPAFYLRESRATVDARFDSVEELAGYVEFETQRSGRGVVIANPIPFEHEINVDRWRHWLAEAQAAADQAGVTGRAVTPFLLKQLHERSDGETLRANVALVRANAELAAQLAACGGNASVIGAPAA